MQSPHSVLERTIQENKSSYQQALDQANLTSLDRRKFICKKLMADMRNKSHPISFLAPQVKTISIPYQSRSGNTKTTATMIRTKRANDLAFLPLGFLAFS